jgi:sec-independent protein translocase protein TatA
MGWQSPSHWVVIALVVLVLFGYKKLPEMSRSVGRSLRIFKTEIKGMDADDAARNSAETSTASKPGVADEAAAQPPLTPPVTPSAVAPVTPVALPPAAEDAPQQRTQA